MEEIKPSTWIYKEENKRFNGKKFDTLDLLWERVNVIISYLDEQAEKSSEPSKQCLHADVGYSICPNCKHPKPNELVACQVCSKCQGNGCNLCHPNYIAMVKENS